MQAATPPPSPPSPRDAAWCAHSPGPAFFFPVHHPVGTKACVLGLLQSWLISTWRLPWVSKALSAALQGLALFSVPPQRGLPYPQKTQPLGPASEPSTAAFKALRLLHLNTDSGTRSCASALTPGAHAPQSRQPICCAHCYSPDSENNAQKQIWV